MFSGYWRKKSFVGYLLIFKSRLFWGYNGYLVTQMRKSGASSLMTVFSGSCFTLLHLLIYIIVKKGKKELKISKKGLQYITGCINKMSDGVKY